MAIKQNVESVCLKLFTKVRLFENKSEREREERNLIQTIQKSITTQSVFIRLIFLQNFSICIRIPSFFSTSVRLYRNFNELVCFTFKCKQTMGLGCFTQYFIKFRVHKPKPTSRQVNICISNSRLAEFDFEFEQIQARVCLEKSS